MADDLSQDTVDRCLRRLGPYRVRAAAAIAKEGSPDAFSGALLLAVGLRESLLWNINNAADTDHGCFQINQVAHREFLESEPGCPEGTWRAVAGHTAIEPGYCPRFTPAARYALSLLKDAYRAKDVEPAYYLRFAIAAYNAGVGGAYRGYREGDADKYTSGGDYSAWVLRHRRMVNASPFYQKWSK